MLIKFRLIRINMKKYTFTVSPELKRVYLDVERGAYVEVTSRVIDASTGKSNDIHCLVLDDGDGVVTDPKKMQVIDYRAEDFDILPANPHEGMHHAGKIVRRP